MASSICAPPLISKATASSCSDRIEDFSLLPLREREREPNDQSKRRGEIFRTRKTAVCIHPVVGDREQLGDSVVTDRDRIALIASALEEVRGRHLLAHRRRHGHPVA